MQHSQYEAKKSTNPWQAYHSPTANCYQKKAGSDDSEAKATQSELQILKSETKYTRKETSRTCLTDLQHVLCIISLTRSKIASKTSETKTRVPNSLQLQRKRGRKKERHIIQKSSPTTFYEKTSTRTKKDRSKKKKEKSTGTNGSTKHTAQSFPHSPN